MINDSQARKQAGEYIARLSGSDVHPLREVTWIGLPAGWRFVYELYTTDNLRVRHAMLILFIDRETGSETEELNTLTDHLGKLQVVEQVMSDNNLKLPNLQTSMADAREQLAVDKAIPQEDIAVLTYEPVVEFPEDASRVRLGWRMVVQTGNEISVPFVSVSSAPDEGGEPTVDIDGGSAIHFKNAPPQRKMINFIGKKPSQKIKFSLFSQRYTQADARESIAQLSIELLARYCLGITESYLRQLGFSHFSLNNAITLNLPLEDDLIRSRPEASVGLIGSQPTIYLPIQKMSFESWGDDPSIIFHEIGHALFYLFYVKTPLQEIEDVTIIEAFRAFEEGFCDFFAALMMEHIQFSAFAGQYGIGGLLPEKLLPKQSNFFKLPRRFGFGKHSHQLFTARADVPPEENPSEQSSTRYRIGNLWSHFLWRLRTALMHDALHESLTQEEVQALTPANKRQHLRAEAPYADAMLLSAFFKPRFPEGLNALTTPGEVTECYLHSIRSTLELNNTPYPRWGEFVKVQRKEYLNLMWQ